MTSGNDLWKGSLRQDGAATLVRQVGIGAVSRRTWDQEQTLTERMRSIEAKGSD
jgi:hypothetical protein